MNRQSLCITESRRSPGPATLEGKARALANLRPWRPGQSGNPAGRTTYGATVCEWLNALAGATRSELQAILDDPSASSAKQAAACQALAASQGDGTAFDRCIDRTQGKPTQRLNHEAAAVDPATRTRTAIDTARTILGLPRLPDDDH